MFYRLLGRCSIGVRKCSIGVCRCSIVLNISVRLALQVFIVGCICSIGLCTLSISWCQCSIRV